MKKHMDQPTCNFQRSMLYTSIMISLGLLSPTHLLANPNGGVVVGGQAKITQGAGVTTIDQTSGRAIINWRDFGVGQGELTQFNQPGQNAIALNRVLGENASNILGLLRANGQVWLVNPNGILIGPTAQINVHGLLATTADIADQDFLAGRYHFSIPSPNPDASVVNQGLITIGQHGFGGLVAPHVRNSGLITGRLGQVVIAGTPTFTLDYYGDGLIQFAATSQITESSDPSRPLVENDGTISVDGGNILITANAAANVVEEVINTSGVIEARSFAVEDGAIVLMGGDEGIVNVAGVLDTSGAEPGAAGGSVDVLGDKVLIADGAQINTSGPGGGGAVHVGGDLRGEGDRKTASQTIVMVGAQVTADATNAGDGGQVVIWADDIASIHGDISARGGVESGDGGFIETSGKNYLDITSTPDASATNGAGGEWLLDPANITIEAGYGESDYYSYSISGESEVFLTDLAALPCVSPACIDFESSTVYAGSISDALSRGTSVTIDTSSLPDTEANGDITQKENATITMGNYISDSVIVATLTLNAENSILLNGTIMVNDFGGEGIDNAQLNVALNADSDNLGGGAIVMNPGSRITTNGGNVTMRGVGTDHNGGPGIYIDFDTLVSTTGGNIELTGDGYQGKDGLFNNTGIVLYDSHLNSGEGNIILTGIGGDGKSSNYGISIEQGSIVQSSGNGNITLSGKVGGGTFESITTADDGQIITGGTTTINGNSGNVKLEGYSRPNTYVVNSLNRVVVNSGQNVSISNEDGIRLDYVSVSGDLSVEDVGYGDDGGIVVAGSILADGLVYLDANSDITVLDSGSITGEGAAFFAYGSINLDGGVQAEASISEFDSAVIFVSQNGFSNSARISTDSDSIYISADDISIEADIVAGPKGDISLEANSTIEQTSNSALTANQLFVYAESEYSAIEKVSLKGPNQIDQLHACGCEGYFEDFEFSNAQDLLVNGIAAGSVKLDIDGTLTLGEPIVGTSDGDAIVIHANKFINRVDPEYGYGLQAEEGRFLVYSENKPGGDSRGNLDEISKRVFGRNFEADPPYTITEKGNLFLYDAEAILKVIANNLTFEYGEPISLDDLTGYIDPDGLFEGDSLSDAVAGEAKLSLTPNLPPEVPVSGSPYVILAENGTLTSPLGYKFEFVNGDLTITPAPLTMVFNGATREYGDPNSAIDFDIAYAGFKFGQDRSALGAYSFITNAVQASHVVGNPYNINITGFENTNYRIDAKSITGGDLIITPAPLLVRLDGAQREYGDSNALVEFDAAYEGFKLEDSEAGLGAFSFVTNADRFSHVADNPYDIGITGFENTDYQIAEGSITDGPLFITPAPLLFLSLDAHREYGDPNSTIEFDFTYESDGFKLEQGESDLGTYSFVTDAVQDSHVADNPYYIRITGFGNPDYRMVEGGITSGDLIITPAPLAMVFNGANREYGDPNSTIEFNTTIEGFKLEQGTSNLGAFRFVTNAVQTSHVVGNPYNIAVTGFENTDYQIGDGSLTGGELIITPAPLLVRLIGANREYGDPNSTIEFDTAIEGFKLEQGESDLGAYSFVTDAVLASHVAGNPYDIRITGIANPDYRMVEGGITSGDLIITPAPLAMVFNGANREYGDPNSTIDFDFTYESDDFKLEQGESDLGTYSFVTDAVQASHVADNPYDIRITGFGNPDYRMVEGGVTSGDLIITPAPLAMVFNGANREYGDPNSTIEFDATIEGFKLEQGTSNLGAFSFVTDAVQASHVVGNPYDIAVTGFENTDYQIGDGSLTAGELIITPAPLLVRLNGADREYGDPNASIEFDTIIEGFKLEQGESDLGAYSFITDAVLASHVAGNPYSIDITGFENTDYRMGEGSITSGELIITPAPLLVRLSGAGREYGDPNATIEFDTIIEGFKLEQGESDLGTYSFVTDAIQASDVADNPYNIDITGFENADYRMGDGSISGGKLTITPAPLSISVNDASREYGDANPVFGARYEGFKLGQDESVLGDISIDTSANEHSPVVEGHYDIVLDSSGIDNANYNLISGDNGKLTITPAPLVVSVNDASREYGERNPEFDARYKGFKLDQDKSVLGDISIDTSANERSPVVEGHYDIVLDSSGIDNANYNLISDDNGKLIITPAPLVVSVNDASREYGDPNPEFDARYEGFKLNQDKSVLREISIETKADKFSPVVDNPYPISLTSLNNTNYVVDGDKSSNGKLTIKKAPLAITVNNTTRGFGEDDPVFTFTFNGFKLGEDPQVIDGLIIESDARKESRAGEYNIRLTGATASDYSIQPISGILKVSPDNLPGGEGDIVTTIQPSVPADKNTTSTISATMPRNYTAIYSTSGVEFLTQLTDKQLNPEVNKLLGPKLNQQGNQQDELLFSNDGNHELWGK